MKAVFATIAVLVVWAWSLYVDEKNREFNNGVLDEVEAKMRAVLGDGSTHDGMVFAYGPTRVQALRLLAQHGRFIIASGADARDDFTFGKWPKNP